jgi:hypothetical protein
MYYGVVTKQNRTNETVGLSFSILSAALGVFMGAIGTVLFVMSSLVMLLVMSPRLLFLCTWFLLVVFLLS